jgi:hypothetical protein
MIRRGVMSATAMVAALLSGCVTAEIDGDITTFTYDLWMRATIPLLLIGCVAIGWRLRRSGTVTALAPGWALIIGAVVIAPILLPVLLGARVDLSNDGFVQRSALCDPDGTTVRFADTDRIELVVTTPASDPNRRKVLLHCYERNGQFRIIEIGQLMLEGALLPVLERASMNGVSVVDQSR